MVFKTTTGESRALGLWSRSDDHETELLFGFPTLGKWAFMKAHSWIAVKCLGGTKNLGTAYPDFCGRTLRSNYYYAYHWQIVS
eukprot:scaffold953_cov39-Cyclotella_meneghiniana.AAC.1